MPRVIIEQVPSYRFPTGHEGIVLRSNEHHPVGGIDSIPPTEIPNNAITFMFTAPMFTDGVTCLIQLYQPDGQPLFPASDSRFCARVTFAKNEDEVKCITVADIDIAVECRFDVWLEDPMRERSSPDDENVKLSIYV